MKNKVDPQLRFAGSLIQFINSDFSKKKLKIFHKIARKRLFKPKSRFFVFRYESIQRSDQTFLKVCVFQPRKITKKLPGILWLHGGGYAMGAPENATSRVKEFMKTSLCIVIAPAYRLSPEAPYPAALEDAYATLMWMKENAQRLNLDDKQLAVGGESAGGGLTAAVALYARDKKEVKIAFQMPLYPMLDDRMITASSQSNTAPLWNSVSNQNAWKLYLKDLYQQDTTPIYAAPARTNNYDKLPPTITFVGGLDLFKDEVTYFVEGIKEAGIPVFFKVFEGAYHSFDRLCPWADISKEATRFLLDAYQYALDHYFAKQPPNLL